MDYDKMAELVRQFGIALEPHLKEDWRLYEIVLRMALYNPEGAIEFMERQVSMNDAKKNMNEVCKEQIEQI